MFDIYAVIFLALVALTVLPPVARILRRAGFSRWWCVLALLPILGLVGLWVLAFVRWPKCDAE